MANYKRGKSRVQTSPHTSQRIWDERKKRLGGAWNWTGSYPRWHDIVYHNRPHRRAVKAMEKDIVADRIDMEEACWPIAHKPHKYYW